MPQDSPLPLPSPTTQRDGWRVDRHGRIFARVLTSNERPFNAYGLSPAEKLAVVSFYEGSPSIDVPYSIERFYPNREYYYHVRMEVILVPAWAQDSSPGIERTLQTWERLYPEDGFPPGAKRYYHFYVRRTPPPLASPIPLRYELQVFEGWTADRDGVVCMGELEKDERTDAIINAIPRNLIGVKVVQVPYWRSEDLFSVVQRLRAVEGTERPAGNQYPPGAVWYLTLFNRHEADQLLRPIEVPIARPPIPNTPPRTARHGYPPAQAPIAPRRVPTTPPRTAQHGYSDRQQPGTLAPKNQARDSHDSWGGEPQHHRRSPSREKEARQGPTSQQASSSRPTGSSQHADSSRYGGSSARHAGSSRLGSSYTPEYDERRSGSSYRPTYDEEHTGSSYRPAYRDERNARPPPHRQLSPGWSTRDRTGGSSSSSQTRSDDQSENEPSQRPQKKQRSDPPSQSEREESQRGGLNVYKPYPRLPGAVVNTREAVTQLLEANRKDATAQYRPKWPNNVPACFKDFLKEVPSLCPGGQPPNHTQLRNVIKNLDDPSVPQIFEQVPCRIVAVNAPGLGIPEFRLLPRNQWGRLESFKAMDAPVQFYEEQAHLPFVLRPPYRAKTLPYPQMGSDLVRYVPEDNNFFRITEQYRNSIVGPGSRLSSTYGKDLEYLQKLENLGAVASSRMKTQMNVLEVYRELAPNLSTQVLKYKEWCQEIDRLEWMKYEARALVHLATHMALNTIAYCAGVQAPKFPADETLMGTIFYPPLIPQAPNPQTPEDDERMSAVFMERLGVPCWGVMRAVQPQRLDFDPQGKPDPEPVKEQEFQAGMRRIARRRKPQSVPVYTQEYPCPQPSVSASGMVSEFTDELKAIIVRALDSEMPDAYTIEETNAKMKEQLGADVWSGERYEDGCHIDKEGRAWYQTRDFLIHMGSHFAVARAHLEVPPGYFDPKLRFPLRTGQAPNVLTRTTLANRPVILPAIAQGCWYRLTSSPYPLDTNARPLAEQYRTAGVLAFKSNVVVMKERGVRQKESPKAVEISLLFKQREHRDAVLQEVRNSDPSVDARAVEDRMEVWRSDFCHFWDEGYIRQLFADARPVNDIKALLDLAPPSHRPLNIRENASTMAIDIENARQALLVDMFETSKYPPLIRSPNVLPMIPRTLGQFWCTSQFLHELTQAPRPANFSEADDMQFKRLSLFLLLLAEFSNPAFRLPLYASRKGPYVRLMRHIVRHIQQAFDSNSSQCGASPPLEPARIFHQGAQDESIGAEYVQYAPKDRRFFIVLDLDRDVPEYVPTQLALEGDQRRVELAISRVVDRSKNKGKQKDI